MKKRKKNTTSKLVREMQRWEREERTKKIASLWL
jgi:hypothetical protein